MSLIPTTINHNVIRYTKTQGFQSFPVKSLEAGHKALERLLKHRVAYQGERAFKRSVTDYAGNAVTEIEIQRSNAPDEQYWIAAIVENNDQQ
tara:strand:+ start:1770 stop:2045 length:276 start_codon:yes stop_codon:yes gene_type:complete